MGRAERLWSRGPGWQVTVTAIGVIIAAGAVAVAKWPHAWWWLIVVTAAAAAATAAAPGVLAAVSTAASGGREVARTIGADGGRLPAAADAGLEARVHPTVLAVPYIRRDPEEVICGHLRQGRPVLLVGSSMVGKTRWLRRSLSASSGTGPQ